MGNAATAKLCGREATMRRFALDKNDSLGAGGFGTTIRAYDRAANTPVAAKCVSLRKMSQERVEKEVALTKRCAHDFVIQVIAAARHHDDYYIFMELCHEELFTLVERRGTLGESEARRFFTQIMRAVDHCHALGVVHRDLKLENVMLTKANSVRVIDFGLAHRFKQGPHAPPPLLYHCCGSRSYCAPEVLSQAGYSYDADVWSVGVALFSMLLGFFPLEEASHADWRFDRLTRAQQEGKCSVTTILQWYNKTTKLSVAALDLLDGLLATNALARPSASSVLRHPWLAPEARPTHSPAPAHKRRPPPVVEKSDSIAGYLATKSAHLLGMVDKDDDAIVDPADAEAPCRRRPQYRAGAVEAELLRAHPGGLPPPPRIKRDDRFGIGGCVPTLPAL